jgi:hypothetical protein
MREGSTRRYRAEPRVNPNPLEIQTVTVPEMDTAGKTDAPTDTDLFERLWRDHEAEHIPPGITPTARRRLRMAYLAGATGVSATIGQLKDVIVSKKVVEQVLLRIDADLARFRDRTIGGGG